MDEHLDTILYIVLTIFLLLFSIFRKKKKLSEQVAGDTDELLPLSSDDWESSDDYEQNNEVKDIQNIPDPDIIKPNEHKVNENLKLALEGRFKQGVTTSNSPSEQCLQEVINYGQKIGDLTIPILSGRMQTLTSPSI